MDFVSSLWLLLSRLCVVAAHIVLLDDQCPCGALVPLGFVLDLQGCLGDGLLQLEPT